MYDLKACVVCLSTDARIHDINSGQIRHDYNTISGIQSYKGNGLPEYLCSLCLSYIRKFLRFREKCQKSFYILQQILRKNNQISKVALNELNRKTLDLNPTLSYLELNVKKNKYETAQFTWTKQNRLLNTLPKQNIPVLCCSTISDDVIFEIPVLNQQQPHREEFKVETEEPCTDTSTQKSNEINEIQPTNGVLEFLDNDSISDVDDFENNDQSNGENDDNEVHGSNLDGDYAKVVPISMKEAKAVVEIYKSCGKGKMRCKVCGRAYQNEERLKIHMRMHDQFISGRFFCELCNYYYKTEFLLKTHITEKHMYKYECKRCPEVSFDRSTAKKHFIWTHVQKYHTKYTYSRTAGLCPKEKPKKKKMFIQPAKKKKRFPQDFLTYTPISHEEQYALINDRKKKNNYIESAFKCEFCYKGFREAITYKKHMKKHDPALSGGLQCDACKLYFPDTRKMYKHMNSTHIFKYTCKMCSYVCFSKPQAKLHYAYHQNVTFSCPHCSKVFHKISTRLTHIRIKHPSTYICSLCGHSFVSEAGLYCHKKLSHSKEEIEQSAEEPDRQHRLYCPECQVQFRDDAAFATHFGSSNKHADTNLSIQPVRTGGERGRGRRGRAGAATDIVNNGLATPSICAICGKHLINDTQASKHYEKEHPGTDYLKRYMCDICGHTTRQYANLAVHMRTHTREKPYACPHCERRFSMTSNRDRHLVVHTGEKPYQCQHCHRRFTQSSAVKLHVQTVHLKIPYAPWDRKNRKRRRDGAPAAPPEPRPAPAPAPPAHDYLNAYITYNE